MQKSGSPHTMVSWVSTVHAQKTSTCRRIMCSKTWSRIPQLLSRLCLAHTRTCIASFSAELTAFTRHLILSGCSTYPSSALTLLYGSRKLARMAWKILMSGHLLAGYGPCIHTRFPPPDAHTQLVAQSGFPRVFVGTEGILLLSFPLLGDSKVDSVDRHQAIIVANVIDKQNFKIELKFCEVLVRRDFF